MVGIALEGRVVSGFIDLSRTGALRKTDQGRHDPDPVNGRERSCPKGNHRRCMAMRGNNIHLRSNIPILLPCGPAHKPDEGWATEPLVFAESTALRETNA